MRFRQRLIARARAVADEIQKRVQRALEQDPGDPGRGASEPPPSFA
jgi:hypothetical protein